MIIDSITYNIPCKVINRKADILYKSAKRTEDGKLHSQVIGVFYNYDVEAGMSKNNIADYVALWLKITEPATSHTIVMPNETGTVTFDCYFGSIKDEVVKWKPAQNYFRNLSFSVIGISPARTP